MAFPRYSPVGDRIAAVGPDGASVAWSPDEAELFVYGSTGARLVDATTGETDLLPYLAGFGAIAWLPYRRGPGPYRWSRARRKLARRPS
jgi:hypothetical protein